MRDLIVSLFIVGSLPTCFRRPFIGLLMFTLLAYMRVQDLTWGFARFQRWSFYVAIITLAGYLVARGEKRFMSADVRNWMMIALAALIGASLIAGRYTTAFDLSIYIDYLKVIGVALFTTGVVRNREYLRILVWVIALSFGFFGVKSGVAAIVTGGQLKIIQGPGGMLADNNDFALALCMGVPMLLALGWVDPRPLLKKTFLCMVPLTILTIMATHSRGSFIAIVATSCVIVWRAKNRFLAAGVLFLMLLAGAIAAPRSYVERLLTIRQYETEGSAKGRLDAWKVAFNMIEANPLLGVGFDKFQRNYKRYDPNALTSDEGNEGTRVAHNSYLQIWAECGTPAFLIYLGLIALSYFDLWRLRREAERRYYSSWILIYTTMFEASLTAFVVGSFFLNRAHFDLFYHFVAIIAAFTVIARREMADPVAHPLRGDGGHGPLQWVRPGGSAAPRRRGFVNKIAVAP